MIKWYVIIVVFALMVVGAYNQGRCVQKRKAIMVVSNEATKEEFKKEMEKIGYKLLSEKSDGTRIWGD